jgi:predicted permease
LDGRSYEVVGVMPASFRFNEDRLSEYWIPLAHFASGRYAHQYQAYGRLRPGVSVDVAQAQMTAIARQIEAEHPDTNAGWGVRVTGLRDALRRAFGPVLLLFWVTVAVVFLVACANVANLLIARGASRGREIAVRRALGATRWRVVRLLVLESLLLSLAAGACGLLVVRWSIDLAVAAAPDSLDLRSVLHVDGNVLLFAFALSLLTGLLAGLAPAMQTIRADVRAWLAQAGGATGSSARAGGSASAFVVAQVALAVLLVVPAGLLTKDLVRLLDVDLGFRTEDVLTARLHLPTSRYRDPQHRANLRQNLLDRIRVLPGVRSVGAGWAMPLGDVFSGGAIEIEGQPRPADWTRMEAQYNAVSTDYFRTLGISLLAGREFTEDDREGSEPVVIVNDVFRHRYLVGVEPIGQRIRSGSESMSIVGVVGDVRHQGPERPAGPRIYRPLSQGGDAISYLVVRTAGPPAALSGALRAAVRSVDRALPIEIRTMEEALSAAVSQRRHIMAVVTFFSLVALAISAVGLAGLLWRSVTLRTREIGIRMALGARPGQVVGGVLSRSAVLVVVGLAVGLAAAVGLARLLGSLLVGVSPHDLSVLVAAALLVAIVSALASWVPARRAAGIHPGEALRHE